MDHLLYLYTQFLILLLIPSANVFVFDDFNIQHKDCLTYSSGSDRSQTTLLRWLTFQLGSHTMILKVFLF